MPKEANKEEKDVAVVSKTKKTRWGIPKLYERETIDETKMPIPEGTCFRDPTTNRMIKREGKYFYDCKTGKRVESPLKKDKQAKKP